MKIDCNKNQELADELANNLKQDFTVTLDKDQIIIDKEISASIIESILKKTGRPKHRAFLIETDKILIAIPQDLHDIGMESCEFCGYVGFIESVEVHRRSHQAL